MRRKSQNVKFDGIHPVMVMPLFRMDEWWRRTLGFEMTITSCIDGRHSPTSRHYIGTAVDLRTWDSPDSGRQIQEPHRSDLLRKFIKYLGRDWFVIDEGDHWHVDYRPRRD